MQQVSSCELRALKHLPKRRLTPKQYTFRQKLKPHTQAAYKPGTLQAYAQRFGFNRPNNFAQTFTVNEKKSRAERRNSTAEGDLQLDSDAVLDCDERREIFDDMYSPDCDERRRIIMEEIERQI